jgi:hypothetical protein
LSQRTGAAPPRPFARPPGGVRGAVIMPPELPVRRGAGRIKAVVAVTLQLSSHPCRCSRHRCWSTTMLPVRRPDPLRQKHAAAQQPAAAVGHQRGVGASTASQMTATSRCRRRRCPVIIGARLGHLPPTSLVQEVAAAQTVGARWLRSSGSVRCGHRGPPSGRRTG